MKRKDLTKIFLSAKVHLFVAATYTSILKRILISE